jgi:hypothetical protein
MHYKQNTLPFLGAYVPWYQAYNKIGTLISCNINGSGLKEKKNNLVLKNS